MRPSHSEHSTKAANVNLTPLIDMVFILLIFFLVTASFTKEAGIEVDRPSAQTAVRQEASNLVIAIDKNNEIWVENRNIDIRTIRAYVEQQQAQNPEGSVIILADKDSRAGMTVDVLDQVRLAGVTKVAIAAERE
ncbi:MAG: biopolymer transporter ExbD [Gammaproteobacteria bacterium]|nr:biopolymer transporter ExbD [Gammaproteobacteria bacterium]NIN62694.1 biopolymer transporter ExbD [Gammaproteobacteria bacterium]NIO63232.1 biopolymer transporter ExbD [Gammaproteobacteria bacterium]NIQ11272.1 biopolymer transporter ExbD [Gammaproteobacteria bacterium]NIQ20332.1 biopolymer transporter ExbD [Gammaproteobacteria bacterium]